MVQRQKRKKRKEEESVRRQGGASDGTHIYSGQPLDDSSTSTASDVVDNRHER